MDQSTEAGSGKLSTENCGEEQLTDAMRMWERVRASESYLSFQAYRKWLEARDLTLRDLGIEDLFKQLEQTHLDVLIGKYAADEQANPGTRAVDLLYLLEKCLLEDKGLDAARYGLNTADLRCSIDQTAGILYQNRSLMKKLGLAPILNSDSYQ